HGSGPAWRSARWALPGPGSGARARCAGPAACTGGWTTARTASAATCGCSTTSSASNATERPRLGRALHVVFGQRALGRAIGVGEAELRAQRDAAVAHRVHVFARARALPLEGAHEGFLAMHEIQSAAARQLDPLQVLLHRVAARDPVGTQ